MNIPPKRGPTPLRGKKGGGKHKNTGARLLLEEKKEFLGGHLGGCAGKGHFKSKKVRGGGEWKERLSKTGT